MRASRAGWAVAALAGLVLAGMAPVSAAVAATPAGCAAPAGGQAACSAVVAPGSTSMSESDLQAAATLPPGYGPLDLRSAYGLESSSLTGGVGQTVAVVTDYGDPTAESDLATYRSEYSLPPCSMASGCLTVMNENGDTSDFPPVGPAGWTLATADSLDMISAICPNCHILLVEAGTTTDGATTAGITDEGTAEDTAVSEGAKFITNTFGSTEASLGATEPTYDTYFNHPGVAITAPDGNGAGYGTWYPAASPDVIAVGGTTLTKDSSTARGWTETAWSGTGSGCSPYETQQPSWQAGLNTGCTTRMLNDAAAVADPATGVAAYDTTAGGWEDGGGGDVASAIVAAAYALAGTPAAGSYPASYLYGHDRAGLVNDITSGSNGSCTTASNCTAGAGYDGPSGVGSIASATALGATAPDDSLTGGPAVADPENGSLDVFGVGNANGTVWGDSWTKSGGWSGWTNMGGTLKGQQLSSVYNPASGNLEVYGLNGAGDVMEDYTANGTTWSGWKSLGGTFGGPPSAVYDPLDNSLDVWEIGTTGTAFEDSWRAGAGWSGWKNESGTFSQGGLDAVYDPIHQDMQVYGTGNANGTVWGGSYTPSGGFSGWSNMSGNLTGQLSAVYDPLSHNMEVYGQDTSGFTEESYSSNGGSTWTSWHELPTAGPSLSYPPNAVYDPANNALEVWAAGSNGTSFDDSWTPGGGWTAWQNHNGVLGSGLYPAYDPNAGELRIFGVGQGTSGTVWGAALAPAGAFTAWGNMSGGLQTGDM
jgi:hypothetical protein